MMEEARRDPRTGRFVSLNFADYREGITTGKLFRILAAC